MMADLTPAPATTLPRMVRPYISDARAGDGYRTALVLRERDDATRLFVPSRLAVVTVPRAGVEAATPVAYRPRVVRTNILAAVRLCRRHGRRFPRAATVEVLRRLGAARAAVDEAVAVEASPEAVAARERRAARAGRAPEVAAVATAIREKIDFQLAHGPTSSRGTLRPRRRPVPGAHPDQLALAL